MESSVDINEAINSAIKDLLNGNLTRAANTFHEILEIQPDNVYVLHSLGIIYSQLRKYDLAMQYIEQALQIDPNIPDAYNNLGNIYLAKGQLDEAASHYSKALQLNPKLSVSIYNLGFICQEKGQLDEAIHYYQKALQTDPHYIKAYNNLGNVLQEKGLLDEAISCYNKALQLNPDSAEAYNNLGNALQEKGLLDEAISCYHKALQLNPDSAEAYNNLGNALQEKGLLDEAISCYHKALQLNEEYADAHWSLSLVLLSSGHLEQGFKEYEWRFKIKNFISFRRTFSQPAWDGSSLEGKSIFIYSEQGIGDEIMFASCFQEVIDRAHKCIVECDKRLIPIFSRSFPEALFIERVKDADTCSSKLPQTDVVILSGSLPKFLRSDIGSFPGKRYLIPDAEKVQSWRNRLRTLGDGLTVGISWRGGTDPGVRRKRSIELEQWAKLFSLSGLNFINLQYGDCKEELKEVKEKLGITIHDWEDADPLKDLDHFAAEIAALDLILSVDNSTVHMAGALGKPVWVLLPFVPDWRWMLDREDSPWYPTVRLFRQPAPGYWESVMERVARELQMFVKKGNLISPVI
jgi:tetratricopeptide (TPR) repeat protein